MDLKSDEQELNQLEPLEFRPFGSFNPQRCRFSNKLDFAQPENVSCRAREIMEIEVLNSYMLMSINDAYEAEINDRMCTFTLRQLVIDINSKLDRKDFINIAQIKTEEQHTFYDSSDLNQSRTLKRVRSNLFDNVEVRRESFKLDQSKSLSRQNSSRSLINFNGESIKSATFVSGKDGDMLLNQQTSTLTPPNEKKKADFYITVSKPEDFTEKDEVPSSLINLQTAG